MPDTAYQITRRYGVALQVFRNIATVADPETGARDMEVEVTSVRLVVKQPTSYGRIIAAREANRDVGDTTFIFWTNDIPFRVLQQEDYIVLDGVKYQVVSTVVEATSFLVTAREVVGTQPVQTVTLSVGNALGLEGTVEQE